jgi:hypothetical protein
VEEEKKPAKIQIFYVKNPLYRTIYADGLIGGPTPVNMINLTFYATRTTIPKSTLHEVEDNGHVNPIGIASQDSKIGILREMEMGVYINRETAKDIYEYLKKILEPDAKKD